MTEWHQEVEPSADTLQAALFYRGLYVALLRVGFSEDESMTVLRTIIVANAGD